MVYKFKLVSDEVSNFSREIEIDASSSFLQLRNAILDSVGYTKDDIDSFYICDDQWQREVEITLEDMGSTSDQDIWLMEDTPLNELIEDEGQKLVFVFNYLSERSFFMEMKEAIPGRTLSEPICTMKRGNPPVQSFDIDEMERQIDIAAQKQIDDLDLDEEFLGDAQYNDDEIVDGYDSMNLN